MIAMTMAEPPPLHLASPAITGSSPQHVQQIAEARVRGKAIRRCASTANFSAWTMAIFGAITVLTGYSSLITLFLGIGMCALSHFEFRGAKEIRRLNPEAPMHLARNQLIFGALILVYSVLALHAALTQPDELISGLAGYREMQDTAQNLETLIYEIVYIAIGLGAIFGCGGTAWYYASRRKHIEAYLRLTPSWIIELQRAGMTVY